MMVVMAVMTTIFFTCKFSSFSSDLFSEQIPPLTWPWQDGNLVYTQPVVVACLYRGKERQRVHGISLSHHTTLHCDNAGEETVAGWDNKGKAAPSPVFGARP